MKKKLLMCTLCIILCILCFACGKREITVTDEAITINYNSEEYQGLYSGTLVKNVPNGEGKFKSEEGWTFNGSFEEGTFRDKGNVTDYPITVTYQENNYEGLYTGEVVSFLPDGEGEFISEKDNINLSYIGKWAKGEFSGDGELKTNNYTMHFSDVDRVGTYSGETEAGIPSGQGVFTATNSDHVQYTYTGEFKEGIFNGTGSAVYEDDHYTATGNYVNGEFKPGLIDGLNAMGSRDNFKFSIPEETADFINSTYLYINDLNDILPLISNDISYSDYTKQPDKYLGKMVCWKDFTILQVWISDFYDEKEELIDTIAIDNNGHVIRAFGIGAKESDEDKSWMDALNEGAVLNFYGIPLASSSFENVSGGNTNCVVLLNSFYEITDY